jgi:hypothetical protein
MQIGRLACALAAVALGAVSLAGCGERSAFETGSVSGRVTHHGGQPLTNALITFVAPQIGAQASATLGPEGRYQVRMPVKVGEYRVQITPPRRVPPPGGRPGSFRA